MIEGFPEASGAPGWNPTGWRRVVAHVLAYWYLSVIALGLIGIVLGFIWLFSGGPVDAYWSCMDAQASTLKRQGWQPEQAFQSSDLACQRPESLSDQDALAEWIRRWEAA